MGLDHGGTDFHVVLNGGKSLFGVDDVTYRDPVFFQHSITLQAGDTIDLVVGWGPNGNYYGDATGIQFKVTKTD